MKRDPFDNEPARIRSDEAPPRLARNKGGIEVTVRKMMRGEWLMMPHAQCKSHRAVVRHLGGSCSVYRTSELFSVIKILDAPWVEDQVPKGLRRVA